jgi:hypothetical protein
MNIIEKLKQFNVEVTPEMEKAFAGDFLSGLEVEKKLKKAEADRDNWKQRAETAEETLKGFEGKDFDTITKERDEWKKKAEDAEKEYSAKEAEREKSELLKEAFADVEFTSESAKKAIMAQIAENVSVKNGKLIGFNDLLDDAKKNDASAFVSKKDDVRITSGTGISNSNSGGALTKKDIDSIKDTRDRQRAIAESLARGDGIYQK